MNERWTMKFNENMLTIEPQIDELKKHINAHVDRIGKIIAQNEQRMILEALSVESLLTLRDEIARILIEKTGVNS